MGWPVYLIVTRPFFLHPFADHLIAPVMSSECADRIDQRPFYFCTSRRP